MWYTRIKIREIGNGILQLKADNVLYYNRLECVCQTGVSFLTVTRWIPVSNRMLYRILQMLNKANIKIIQIYAPGG